MIDIGTCLTSELKNNNDRFIFLCRLKKTTGTLKMSKQLNKVD